MSVLLIDRGNTRLKWQLKQLDQVVESGVGLKNESLSTIFNNLDINAISNIFVASVANQTFNDELAAWAITNDLPKPNFISSPEAGFGVINGYEECFQLGVDRWLAMIAAYNKLSGNLCVVDVGTALTIDIVLNNGEHLGGYIVPGSELQIKALLANTDKIQTGSDKDVMFVGKNTSQAVKSGVKRMLSALVTQTIIDWDSKLSEPVNLVMTGGGAKELSLSLTIPYLIEKDLVFDGLNMVAGEAI